MEQLRHGMAESSGHYKKLPPGWDCKYDQATGNCYYINYFTKAMQLEDPRIRYKQLLNERCSNESIAMQPMHGSPYHVYPSNNYPAMRAFHAPPADQSLLNVSVSPLLTSSRNYLELSPLPLARANASSVTRPANLSRRSSVQETSFTNPIDTEAVVAKIQNMFPTAGENHIRLLLKRYLKTIFPKADEMLLLDVLASADNNVQIASEKLLASGYIKRDFMAAKATANASSSGRPDDETTIIPLRPQTYSDAEKQAMQDRLKEKYGDIAERIILMALESVSYSEDRAMQILQIVQEEDAVRARKGKDEPSTSGGASTAPGPQMAVDGVTKRNSLHDGQEGGDNVEEGAQRHVFNSLLDRIGAQGYNSELSKGPDDSLLLVDYVTWNGANPNISTGHKQMASGPDASNLSERRSYTAIGRNTELCKGPDRSLPKGSIYAQLAASGANCTANIKCN